MSPPPRQPCVEQLDPIVAEILRRTTAADRVAMMGDASEMARLLAAAGIRYRRPGWSEEQIQAEVARRMLRDAD
jgi:hypothetical protein